MEHERCYIYTPPDTGERASKRRRIDRGNVYAQLPERLQTYRQIWSEQEQIIQTTLEEADQATLEKLVSFVSASTQVSQVDQFAIPTGLVVAGPSIASHGPFFERLGHRIQKDTNSNFVLLTSGESPNLKTFLKNVIQKATSRIEDDEDEDPARSSRYGPKLLNFDLGHIHEWQTRNRADRIVVAIQDSEAFDAGLLAEIVCLFYSWLDRLPFVLLFGIATSAESFEDRLSGKCLRYLEGKKFNVTQSDEILEKLFSANVANTGVSLRIGPILSRRILERQRDHVQNLQDFSDGLKYAYMSHFYASCPSLVLDSNISFKDMPSDVFEAVRNLPSFRKRVEELLDDGKIAEARKLLDSDQFLFDNVAEHVQSGQEVLSALSAAAIVLSRIREGLQLSPQVALSSIWIRVASGEMLGSPLFRETLLSLKKVPSDRFVELLSRFNDLNTTYFDIKIGDYQNELYDLVKDSDASTPLRTQNDVRNESMRTTVVAQKVLLSKHKAALSEQDKAYSDLVGRFHDEIDEYFNAAFINPKDLYLHEVLIYDLKSPHMEVFQPKPRFAIERALGSPHDYLGCDCCGSIGDGQATDAALSASQPATAVVYQLYLESGALINVADLWSAFNAIAGNDEEDTESKTMALFQRALAELKHLGLLKPSRKKVDHVAKAMWKGL